MKFLMMMHALLKWGHLQIAAPSSFWIFLVVMNLLATLLILLNYQWKVNTHVL